MNPKVDAYLKKAKAWRDETVLLREIILDCGLTEELKWGKPCYTFQESNVVLIIPLKETCCLLYSKGALLKDAKKLLTKAGENTQAARWIRFKCVAEITKLKSSIKAYIKEAIAAEKAGLKVEYKKTSEYAVPEELEKKWKKSPAFKAAWDALTPGRQRGYLLHFAAAKQSATRESRIEKSLPQILKGKGWNERRSTPAPRRHAGSAISGGTTAPCDGPASCSSFSFRRRNSVAGATE